MFARVCATARACGGFGQGKAAASATACAASSDRLLCVELPSRDASVPPLSGACIRVLVGHRSVV